MKRVVEGNNFVLLAGWVSCLAYFTGKLYGSFIGFASGIADEHLGGRLHGTRGDRFRDD